MIDLDELRKLAKGATPGPWHFHQDDGTALDISEVCIPRPEEEDVDLSIASLLEDRDGAFIAAANPQVILELIERVREAEAERDAALARIAELEKSYRIVERLYKIERQERIEAEARIAEAAKLHVEVECDAGCLYGVGETPEWGVTTNHCAICTDVPWPCPTAVSLGLNEGETDD